eukprot:5359322-Pyramimonas_sp.AAC.1
MNSGNGHVAAVHPVQSSQIAFVSLQRNTVHPDGQDWACNGKGFVSEFVTIRVAGLPIVRGRTKTRPTPEAIDMYTFE